MIDATTLTGEDWVRIIEAMAAAVAEQREQLAALDSLIGDGDHGANISGAMAAAAAQVAQLDAPTPAAVLRTTGRTVMDEMGGAAGVMFGSFFRGCARAVTDREALDVHDLARMMAAGLAEVQRRGQAQPGDKTLVDALAPAAQAMQAAADAGAPLATAVQRAADSARAGAEATANMVARFGRAKHLGERAIGHQDAGATSVAVMLEAWGKEIED